MRPGLRWLACAPMVALLAVGIAACLQTESLGTEQTAVVGCEPTACRGTPTDTRCSDGTTVPSTGRCVQSGPAGRCDWEPGTCAVVNDTGAPDTRAETPVVDSGSDAFMCPMDTEALVGMGPWNESGSCWTFDSTLFECVDRLGGGAITCFQQISSGRFYLAVTDRIPSGSDFRLCTVAERDARGTTENFCP